MTELQKLTRQVQRMENEATDMKRKLDQCLNDTAKLLRRVMTAEELADRSRLASATVDSATLDAMDRRIAEAKASCPKGGPSIGRTEALAGTKNYHVPG